MFLEAEVRPIQPSDVPTLQLVNQCFRHVSVAPFGDQFCQLFFGCDADIQAKFEAVDFAIHITCMTWKSYGCFFQKRTF